MEDAAQLTKDFLTCLTRPLLESSGTPDKYTGNRLVAFWGAPLPMDDHADLAREAVQQIEQMARRFRVVWKEQSPPLLRIRIRIESGVAMADDVGTSSRSIDTAVGDSVNVTLRLEKVACDYSCNILRNLVAERKFCWRDLLVNRCGILVLTMLNSIVLRASCMLALPAFMPVCDTIALQHRSGPIIC